MQSITLDETKGKEDLVPPPKKPLQPLKQNISMENSPMEKINEKLDKILKYQKHVRRIAIFRGILSFIFFFVFIIAPIIGGFYLVRIFNDKVGVEKVRSQYQDYIKTFEAITKTADSIPKLPTR